MNFRYKKFVVASLILLPILYVVAVWLSVKTMFSYGVCGEFIFSNSDNSKYIVKDGVSKLSRKKNAELYIRSVPGHKGSSSSGYEWLNYGFCQIDYCVSVSNDFEENLFTGFTYSNRLLPKHLFNGCAEINDLFIDSFGTKVRKVE